LAAQLLLPDRRLAWLMAACYFLFYGAVGCLLPYQPLYYQSLGLNGEQIGLLMGLGPVVLLGASPLWGAAADRLNLHRWLLPMACAGAFGFILLVPASGRNLTLLILVVLLQSFFSQAIVPLMDSAALEIAAQTHVGFGRIRFGGSLGFMVISVFIGWLLTRVDLRWMFYSYMIGMSLVTVLASRLPAHRRRLPVHLRQSLAALAHQRHLVFFLLAVFLLGFANNAVQFFLPLFLHSIGGDSNTVGVAGAVGALTELPVMFLGVYLLRKIGGLWPGLALAASVYTLRWLALSATATTAVVLALQLLHGLSFGLFILAGVGFVDQLAPQGLSATAQSLFNVFYWGLGSLAGSLGGGVIYQWLGSAWLFRLCGLATLLSLGLLFGARPASGRPAAAAAPSQL
jgi:PPP family 3-phenylpropionic acid transporter